MNHLKGNRASVTLACALVAIFGFVPGASAELLPFELGSHPDGGEANPNDVNTWYGLRLDDPTTSETETFRFNEASGDPMTLGASTVSAFLDTDTGELLIIGTVYHIQDGDSRYGIEAVIQLDGAPYDAMTIADLKDNIGELWGETISLEMTDLDGGGFQPLSWDGYPDSGANFHIENNHRGVTGLSGFGWLEPTNPDLDHTNNQDWLFTMEYNPDIPPPPDDDVPEPATMALLGLGLAGMMIRSRVRV